MPQTCTSAVLVARKRTPHPELLTCGDLHAAVNSARAPPQQHRLACTAGWRSPTPWHSTASTGASPHAGCRRHPHRHAEGPHQAPPQGLVAPRRPPPRMATRSTDRRSLLHSLASAAPIPSFTLASTSGRDAATPLPPEAAADRAAPHGAPKMTHCCGGSTPRLRAATPPWPTRPAPPT